MPGGYGTRPPEETRRRPRIQAEEENTVFNRLQEESKTTPRRRGDMLLVRGDSPPRGRGSGPCHPLTTHLPPRPHPPKM
jgi:hypothetical protein